MLELYFQLAYLLGPILLYIAKFIIYCIGWFTIFYSFIVIMTSFLFDCELREVDLLIKNKFLK